jgi:hypothetical protein
MKKISNVVLLLGVLFFGGCAVTGPHFHEIASSIPLVAPENGRIYVYSCVNMVNLAANFSNLCDADWDKVSWGNKAWYEPGTITYSLFGGPKVKLNDAVIGEATSLTFFYVDKRPGNYSISAAGVPPLSFVLESGKSLYVRINQHFDGSRNVDKPILVDNDIAQKEIQMCRKQ